MKFLKRTLTTLALAVAITPAIGFACDSAGPQTHIGSVVSIDAAKMTFTIKDAQTRDSITFIADSSEIMNSLKSAKGSIRVNYEDIDDSVNLKAVGVTF